MLHTKRYLTNPLLVENIDISEDIKDKPTIIEPFCGNGDLLKLLNITDANTYDISQNSVAKVHKDTLLENVLVKDSFVITNPPYTANNKLKRDSPYKALMGDGVEDLYQIFIKQCIDSNVVGGVIVVPINFITGKNSMRIRRMFLNKYNVITLNLYELKMFENTTQAVCTIHFRRGDAVQKVVNATLYLYYGIVKIELPLDDSWSIESIFPITTLSPDERTPSNDKQLILKRYYNIDTNSFYVSDIRINLLDPKMYAEYVENQPENKRTDKAFLTVCSNIPIENERDIIDMFNEYLKHFREKTYSLTLSSYIEFSQKKLSFEEALHLLKYCILTRMH